ncbi:MAG TPA: hypothetical protein PLT26_15375 [Anaerolineaceae bacterium]|jgi:hypothetical protein|nr:hypothetical protein [Anaerolineaceae bacterium]
MSKAFFKQVPLDITVRFGFEVCVLAHPWEKRTLKSGVEIRMEERPGGNWKAWASIPEGTLEQHKWKKPIVIRAHWTEISNPDQIEAMKAGTWKPGEDWPVGGQHGRS